MRPHNPDEQLAPFESEARGPAIPPADEVSARSLAPALALSVRSSSSRSGLGDPDGDGKNDTIPLTRRMFLTWSFPALTNTLGFTFSPFWTSGEGTNRARPERLRR